MKKSFMATLFTINISPKYDEDVVIVFSALTLSLNYAPPMFQNLILIDCVHIHFCAFEWFSVFLLCFNPIVLLYIMLLV